MANIKTAISIDKPLFDQVEDLAHELNTSRSRIFAIAAKEFIQRHKNLKLLKAINAAYDDFPDVKEASLKSAMRSRHLKMVKDQW
jgi:metal-responsive CopG/Arc/MetJ family transcriptional regulator